MALTFSQRMDAIESLIVKVNNDINNLASFEERAAVVDEIFNVTLKDQENRIKAIENILDMVERTISTTNGN